MFHGIDVWERCNAGWIKGKTMMNGVDDRGGEMDGGFYDEVDEG